MARRAAPFFFFLLGVAAAVLGETSAAPVVNPSERTPKESDCRVVHVSSLSGELVAQEAAVKVGEEVTVELSNPAGTNYQWVYLGIRRQRDAVPLDTEGDGGKIKEDDEEDEEEDDHDDEQRASSLRGVKENPTMPGGMVTKTFELPAAKEAGKYYHFFAFWSNGDDPTFRVVAVHAS